MFELKPWVRVVETPFAFLKKHWEVLGGYPIEFAQMPLGLVPEVLNTVDMILPVDKAIRMVDAVVAKRRYIQHVVVICSRNHLLIAFERGRFHPFSTYASPELIANETTFE